MDTTGRGTGVLMFNGIMNKISCVMPTYRRFNCVERSIACFLSQAVDVDIELIICNTDVEYPLVLDHTFTQDDIHKIKIYNNNIDCQTGEPYTSTGAIRRDGVSRSSGNLYVTWDDDDIFLPWNLQQCLDGISRTGAKAWKPYKNILWWRETPEVDRNVLEATVIMRIEEAVFENNSGPEGMKWFNRLQQSGDLIEDQYSIPSYCYYWIDPREIGGHKQGNSADINDPNNFTNHMNKSVDKATRSLTKRSITDYKSIYQHFKNFFPEDNQLVQKYVPANFFI